MKRTIPILAVLTAAILFTATAAHAQSALAPQAYPPGPNGQAGTNTTTNVNVVNAPTVQVGNEVTIKAPAMEPVHFQRVLTLQAGQVYLKDQTYAVPAGQQLALENVNVSCVAPTSQVVSVGLYDPTIGFPIASFEPTMVPWNAGYEGTRLYPMRLLANNSVTLAMYRPTGTGVADCTITLLGYLTPLS